MRISTHAFTKSLFAVMLLLLCVATQTAHAQWAVNDADANTALNSINTHSNNIDTHSNNIDTHTQSMDTHIQNIEKDWNIGTYGSPGDHIEDPKQALADLTLAQGIEQCNQFAKMQLTNCTEIVQTQNAEYMYMVIMYNTTSKRNDRLQELLTERQNIQVAEIGKLEDNTNKLTALYTLMAIDRQQMESVVYAYQTRLHYLENEQTRLANSAITGNPTNSTAIGGIDLGSIIGTIASGAILKTALETARTSRPSGMQVLGTEESNGY